MVVVVVAGSGTMRWCAFLALTATWGSLRPADGFQGFNAALWRQPRDSCPAVTPLAAQAGSAEEAGFFSRVKGAFSKLNPLKYKDYGVGEELKSGIASFYDESTAIWEDVWGDHLHHGYYPTGKEKDHKHAQVVMIEESLAFGGATDVKTAVDVGCGIGGSSRHIAKKFGAKVKGITLSPFQRGRAEALTQAAGLGDKAEFQVADALNMPFADNSFDLVWSMESGEHMPDKTKFMGELTRVAAPGGKVIIVTWCHRDLAPGESLTKLERGLLKLINSIYFLPPWVSISHYVDLANQAGLKDVKSADWTDRVKPFWPAVLVSCLKLKSLKVLATSSTVRKGALAILYMILGYALGLIKFGVITGRKAELVAAE